MVKDFDNWNTSKKLINKNTAPEFYHQREVWWCSLGINVGFEIDGTGDNFDRPVLVLKGFNKDTFLGVALTGRKKEGRYYFYLGEIEGRPATAVLSQIRLIDTKRLVKKMAMLDEAIFKELQKRIKTLLFN